MSTKWSRFVLANHKPRMRPWNYVFMPTKTMKVINNVWRKEEKHFLDSGKQLEMRVPLDMNKLEIREYLEKIYGIKVWKVNTLIREGKWKREGKPFLRKKPDWKKAYVTLWDDKAREKKEQEEHERAGADLGHMG